MHLHINASAEQAEYIQVSASRCCFTRFGNYNTLKFPKLAGPLDKVCFRTMVKRMGAHGRALYFIRTNRCHWGDNNWGTILYWYNEKCKRPRFLLFFSCVNKHRGACGLWVYYMLKVSYLSYLFFSWSDKHRTSTLWEDIFACAELWVEGFNLNCILLK